MLRPRSRRIDLHHHYFPESLNKENLNRSIGWRTPSENLPWSPEISLKAMDELGIEMAVLSLPSISTGSIGVENRAWAREQNLYAASICAEYPSRFAFFAHLPFLDDVQGALHEISYALDELGAVGIALTSSYGQGASAKYIGDDLYDTIWEVLNERQAIVFLHGAQTPSSTPYPHEFLGIPITEVPNETFKAAAHLVVTGKKRRYPSIKVVLAHMGGGTPLLAARVSVLSPYMGCRLSPDEILADFRSFYYDTALSGYETNLVALESFLGGEVSRILFGTDFPAVSTEMARWYTQQVDEYYSEDADTLEKVMHRNMKAMLPLIESRLEVR